MLNNNIAELVQNLTGGQIACPYCHTLFSRDGLAPLSTVTCPTCGKPFLVGIQVGKYYLQECLGKGSYLALSQEEREMLPVVVKVIPTDGQDNLEDIKALWTEAQMGGLLNDTDFIAGCLDHGVSNGYYYIVRPYIEGERLDQFMARQGKLAIPNAITLALHILAGLQHLYRLGFLYRNLCPEKVFVNQAGYAVLHDLGQCRTLTEASELAPFPTAVVSPYYAPERLLNQGETIASEIYSLGMLLFYMLTGTHYYTESELIDLIERCFKGTRPANPHLAALPASLAILLDSMLRLNRAERPQDCPEVADSLKAILTELEDE
ncbi:MAG: serine/threonine protein kinase [Victivallales bacterium]|nr:serine/threonine protein kinase [Victivallales bacterium]